jgi:hypothetical protein
VGWIQVVFNDPEALPLALKDDGYVITVPETGVSRTSHIRVHDFRRKDEFYYDSLSPRGAIERLPVPPEFVIPGDSHGGFGVMDTGGKGSGYSWFIFIGPPELRTKVPLADWEKVVEEYRKTHGGKANVRLPNPYPTPGRILLTTPAQKYGRNTGTDGTLPNEL